MKQTLLTFLAACWITTPARAGTITVTGTLAQTSAINCYAQGPFSANCSESHGYGSATTVADALAGHLGAFLGASSPGYVNGFAQIGFSLALKDMTADDFLEVDMSLHGTFSNGGATASLYIDTGDSFSAVQILCSDYYLQNYGVPCSPGTGLQQIFIPLANLDNLYLTLLLQPSLSYAPAFSDFLHSEDFTITVPAGTSLVNNPGGTVFQGVTAVPEPSPGLFAVSGLILILLFGKRTAIAC